MLLDYILLLLLFAIIEIKINFCIFQILKSLLKKLSFYEKTAVQPGNKPVDPMSNPKYHNYEWINWMDYA